MGKSSWPNRGHRIKHLILHDEKIDVIPHPDPRNLQTLIMALSEEEFQRITQSLSLRPNLTPNEFRNMLLDEEKKQAAVAKGPDAHAPSEASGMQGKGYKLAGGGEGKGQYCNNCKKDGHREDRCWLLHPELPGKPPCSACGKVGHGEDGCWKCNPKFAPAWWKRNPLKQNTAEAKGKGRGKAKASCLLKMVEEG